MKNVSKDLILVFNALGSQTFTMKEFKQWFLQAATPKTAHNYTYTTFLRRAGLLGYLKLEKRGVRNLYKKVSNIPEENLKLFTISNSKFDHKMAVRKQKEDQEILEKQPKTVNLTIDEIKKTKARIEKEISEKLQIKKDLDSAKALNAELMDENSSLKTQISVLTEQIKSKTITIGLEEYLFGHPEDAA